MVEAAEGEDAAAVSPARAATPLAADVGQRSAVDLMLASGGSRQGGWQ
jgi:hypothetical protein